MYLIAWSARLNCLGDKSSNFFFFAFLLRKGLRSWIKKKAGIIESVHVVEGRLWLQGAFSSACGFVSNNSNYRPAK
jgi:hypothetical protein